MERNCDLTFFYPKSGAPSLFSPFPALFLPSALLGDWIFSLIFFWFWKGLRLRIFWRWYNFVEEAPTSGSGQPGSGMASTPRGVPFLANFIQPPLLENHHFNAVVSWFWNRERQHPRLAADRYHVVLEDTSSSRKHQRLERWASISGVGPSSVSHGGILILALANGSIHRVVQRKARLPKFNGIRMGFGSLILLAFNWIRIPRSNEVRSSGLTFFLTLCSGSLSREGCAWGTFYSIWSRDFWECWLSVLDYLVAS